VPNCDTIALQNFWVSQANVGNYPVMVVGDLDGDGLPEIVTHRVHRDSLFIIDGQNGATKHATQLPRVANFFLMGIIPRVMVVPSRTTSHRLWWSMPYPMIIALIVAG